AAVGIDVLPDQRRQCSEVGRGQAASPVRLRQNLLQHERVHVDQAEFRERGSEWWSGDVYVFAYAPDGTVRLSPAVPAREGRAYHGEKDKKGKAFHDEILNTAQTKGSGWVDYWLPKPGQTEPSHKWSYVKAVKAEGIALVGAGFFPE